MAFTTLHALLEEFDAANRDDIEELEFALGLIFKKVGLHFSAAIPKADDTKAIDIWVDFPHDPTQTPAAFDLIRSPLLNKALANVDLVYYTDTFTPSLQAGSEAFRIVAKPKSKPGVRTTVVKF
jgi:hypothetical protein